MSQSSLPLSCHCQFALLMHCLTPRTWYTLVCMHRHIVVTLCVIIGMEGDVITSHELFTYKFQGEGRDGRLRGTFISSGIRPTFLPRAEYYGLDKMLLEAI